MEEEKRSSLLKFVYPYEDLNKVVIKADWANGKCGAMIVRKEIDGYQAHFVSFNYNEEMDVLLNDNPKKAFQITEQKIDGGSLVTVGFLGHLLANYQMLLECRKSAVDVYKEYFDYRINAFDAEQQSKPMQKRLTRADFVRQHLKNEGLAFDYSKSQKLFSFFTLEDTFLLLDYLWDYMLYFKDNSGCIFSIEKIDYALGGTNLNIINAEKYIEHDLLFENGQVGRMVVGCDSYELDDDVKEFPEDYYWLTFYNSDYDSVVLASGFMVYYLYNQNEETPSIFNGYYEWAKKQYYNTLAKKPRVATLVESEIEKEFAKQHIIDEEIRIKASYALFDYFPLYGCKKIYEFSKAYIKYAESIKKHLWNEADDEVDIIMNDGALDNGVKTPSADTSKEMYPDEENSNPQPNEKTSSTDEPKEDNQEEKEYHKGAIEDFANLEDGYWSHPYLWANGKVGVIINTYKYDNYDGDFEDEHSFFRFVPEEQISEFKAAWIDYNNPDLVWTGSRHEYFAEVLQHLSPVTFELEGMWLEEYIDRTGKRTTDIFEQFFKKEMDKYLKEKSIEPDAATKDYKKEFVFDFHAKYFMYNIDTRLQKYLYEDDAKRIDVLRQQYLEFVKRKAKEMYPDEENSNPQPTETDAEQNNGVKHSSDEKGRDEKFRMLIPNDKDKNDIMNKLHNALDGKKGVIVVKVLKAANKLGWILDFPSYEIFVRTFDSSHNKSGYNTQIATNYSDKDLEPYITSLLKIE